MINLFKKHKRERPQVNEKPNRLVLYILNSQVRLSNYLNRKFSRLSRKTLSILLILFCLVFGGANLYVVINGIWKKAKADQIILPPPKIIPDTLIYKSPVPDTLK